MSTTALLLSVIGGLVVGLVVVMLVYWYAEREIRKSEERMRKAALEHEERVNKIIAGVERRRKGGLHGSV